MGSSDTSVPFVGKRRKYKVECSLRNGQQVTKTIISRPYPQAADKGFKPVEPWIFANAFEHAQIIDCNNMMTKTRSTDDGGGFDSKYRLCSMRVLPSL